MANVALFERQPWQIKALTEELYRGGHNIVAQTSWVDEVFGYLHMMGDGKLAADVIIASPRLKDNGKAHRFDHLHRSETTAVIVPYGLFGRSKKVEVPKITSVEVPAVVPHETDVFVHARAILCIVRGLELPTKVISNSAIGMRAAGYPLPGDAELRQLPEYVNSTIKTVLQ